MSTATSLSGVKKNVFEPEVAKDTSLSLEQKLKAQRSKDIAYTINHALACTFADLAGVPAMVAIQRYFGVNQPIAPGCANPFHEHGPNETHHHHHEHHGHDHHGHEGHNHQSHIRLNYRGQNMASLHFEAHQPPDQAKWDAMHKRRLGAMFTTSEIIGDFAGVIPTVLMQRYTPWAMDAIRPALRFTLGPIFHFGAQNSTNQWAKRNGIAKDSPEYNQHLETIYEHEMHHLPQAAWWTAWATALNLGSQSFFYDLYTSKDIRARFPVGTLGQRATAKIGGSAFSIAAGARYPRTLPESAHRFTNWTEDTFITPLTKVIGGTIGLDDKVVDEAVAEKKQFHQGNWQAAADAQTTPKTHARA